MFAAGRLVTPSLCHAHVHLDKCFLLQDSKYDDLCIEKGDFKEAMTVTSEAKERFDEADLLRRGRRLILESLNCGVTAMRAFAEVDEIVGWKCINAAKSLKSEFYDKCDIQICAFAQLALFSGGETAFKRRALLEQASTDSNVDVIGSTPYVEEDARRERSNVGWTTARAIWSGKHLDFHLDYNVDPQKDAFVWDAIEEIMTQNWQSKIRSEQTLCFGHCTRLSRSLFSEGDWQDIAQFLADLHASFVGLPMSDLFILGKTLEIPYLIKQHNVNGAISINNVGNAFTPQANVDPLVLASSSISIYQAGTKDDASLLYECISSRARRAIGLITGSLRLQVGDPADLVIFGTSGNPASCVRSIAEAVYAPPSKRQVIFQGSLIVSS